MADRPILFAAPMVRALLAGTKTQTRRALPGNLQPLDHHEPLRAEPRGDKWIWMAHTDRPSYQFALGDTFRCPHGQPGDRLYVREAWRAPVVFDHEPPRNIPEESQIQYDALGDGRDETRVQWGKYRHARFMCRWMSRILLEVTGVRVERLQDISEANAIAEGVSAQPDGWFSAAEGQSGNTARAAYGLLWNSINGAGSWDADPWVWAVSFRRVDA